MLTVAVVQSSKRRGREKMPPFIAAGVRALGDKVVDLDLSRRRYEGPVSDVAIFYGFDGKRGSEVHRLFVDYVEKGLKAIYVDLGYLTLRETWSHKAGMSWCKNDEERRFADYHRLSVNARHPTLDFQKVKHPSDRYFMHGRKIDPWKQRRGDYVLLCGMSQKASLFDGFDFLAWEQEAIRTIRQHTDRRIVYRPKPQRRRVGQYPPIPGVEYSNPQSPFPEALKGAWAVVSHHSNAGIHAMRCGIPCFQPEGVAAVMGHADLSLIESPRVPSDEERHQFLFDVAYWQYRRDEMARGLMWRMLKDEGHV